MDDGEPTACFLRNTRFSKLIESFQLSFLNRVFLIDEKRIKDAASSVRFAAGLGQSCWPLPDEILRMIEMRWSGGADTFDGGVRGLGGECCGRWGLSTR